MGCWYCLFLYVLFGYLQELFCFGWDIGMELRQRRELSLHMMGFWGIER
jgi:hypothetical protein